MDTCDGSELRIRSPASRSSTPSATASALTSCSRGSREPPGALARADRRRPRRGTRAALLPDHGRRCGRQHAGRDLGVRVLRVVSRRDTHDRGSDVVVRTADMMASTGESPTGCRGSRRPRCGRARSLVGGARSTRRARRLAWGTTWRRALGRSRAAARAASAVGVHDAQAAAVGARARSGVGELGGQPRGARDRRVTASRRSLITSDARTPRALDMKIVIPGGTGQIGSVLARWFRARGDHVVSLGRNAAPGCARGMASPWGRGPRSSISAPHGATPNSGFSNGLERAFPRVSITRARREGC
jgi:hypothetical protein